MRTSPNRYSKIDILHRGADGVLRSAKVYCYEATNGLYDVVVIEGAQFVRVDMGPLSNLISDWKPHHYAICSHFGLS